MTTSDFGNALFFSTKKLFARTKVARFIVGGAMAPDTKKIESDAPLGSCNVKLIWLDVVQRCWRAYPDSKSLHRLM